MSIFTVDHLKVQRGRFVISNTDISQGPGEHWVTFYFPKRGPHEFFDSLGQMPEDYAIGFEKILNKKYLKNAGQLQQSTSNVCGLYWVYYVVNRYTGKIMKDILQDLNWNWKRNDRFLVSKMRRDPRAQPSGKRETGPSM